MDLVEFYIGFLRDRAKDYAEFLRKAADFLSPKPVGASPPYTPPFTGGQSVGVQYEVRLTISYTFQGAQYTDPPSAWRPVTGKITYIGVRKFDSQTASVVAEGQSTVVFYGLPIDRISNIQILSIEVRRADLQNDTGGNLPNPNPAPPIKDDGLFESKNEPISEQAIVLAPALPLVLVASLIAGYVNAIAAAKAAVDALAAIKKVAEALESLQDLWEKLREFLNDWDKNRKQKKEIVRQNYGGIQGDGTISFYKEGNTKYTAIQLDIVLTSIPNNIGKYFAEYSPNRYPYGGLGYIAFYSINQGILSTHQIEFKRTSYEIPKLAVGFIYHLGLNEQVRGFAFAEFSKLL